MSRQGGALPFCLQCRRGYHEYQFRPITVALFWVAPVTQPLQMPGLGPLSPSQPFEWDRDQPVLLASSTARAPACGLPEAPRKWRGVLLSTVMGLAFVAGLALEWGLWGMPILRNPAAPGMQGAITQPDSLPQGLVIYDLATYRRFASGLRHMGQGDLVAYASAARRDLQAAPPFMAPFHKDALFVIEAEIARRQALAPASWFTAP
jgi:hypothetical protein